MEDQICYLIQEAVLIHLAVSVDGEIWILTKM